jgi:hypothetical protein
MEHEERAEDLEAEANELEAYGDEVGEDIESARRDWEGKEKVIEHERQESDQLPEEGPAEQVPDDAGGDAREEAERSPGVPGEEETGTGNPNAAGAEE